MRDTRSVGALLLLLVLLVGPASAQSTSASLSGTVIDERDAAIEGATVTVLNTATGFRRTATTTGDGTFVVPQLPPSAYSVTVQREGFAPAEVTGVVLNVSDQLALRIRLGVGKINEAVVVSSADTIDASPSVSTTVDRQFIANIPLNGRTLQPLILLTPGIVSTSGNQSAGQFSVNGQRDDANYFSIDGVSANIGVNPGLGGPLVGQEAAGSTPGFSVQGTTNNLVSIDALQEFKIQTSTYAAEFGRGPGGQIQLATRSGSNALHGSVFEYIRNDAFDANDWFRNARGEGQSALRQHNYGGSVGGPLVLPRSLFGPLAYDGRNRTFFFFSFEGLRSLVPVPVTFATPTPLLRDEAAPVVRELLGMYPLPNEAYGPDDILGRFSGTGSEKQNIDATSIRIDHTVGATTIFGRYNHAISDSTFRNFFIRRSPHQVTETLTFGATTAFGARVVNDLRFNWSRNSVDNSNVLDGFGGSTTPSDGLLFPPAFTSPETGGFYLFLFGDGLDRIGRIVDNIQRQVNVIDSVSFITGAHALKFGFDLRQLTPTSAPEQYLLAVGFSDLDSIRTARASFGEIIASDEVSQVFSNYALYAEDTWKVTPQLTLDLGLRWDVNPPTHGRLGKDFAVLTGLDTPSTIAPAPPGTPLYPTRYNAFAPRLGAAYEVRARQGWETVLRGGFGIFYDLGTAEVARAASSYPFSRISFFQNAPFPFDTATGAPPPPPSLEPPFTGASFVAVHPSYTVPRTYHFHLTVDQSLGGGQTLEVSYVSAKGRDLLRSYTLYTPNALFTAGSSVTVFRNADESNYDALQVSFQRRLSHGVQALANYTWGHSIDTSSRDNLDITSPEQIAPEQDRGPSDFDVRHIVNFAVTWDLPVHEGSGVFNAITRHWSVDAIFKGQSASPVDVTVGKSLGTGFPANVRPDLVPGVALYIDDPSAPGGRRINPAAFTVSRERRQGTLGRNSVRGFPLSQLNMNVRRAFHLGERVTLDARAEVFNVLNHPNFKNPYGNIGFYFGGQLYAYPGFGQAELMANTFTSVNSLYETGGPRSIQFALKLLF